MDQSNPATVTARNESPAGRIALLACGLLCVSLVVLWSCFLPWGRALKGQNDFLGLYAGAKLAGTAELFSGESYHKLQTATANIWLPSVLYSRPPFYALLLKPLAALPYRAAYSVFEGLNLAALAIFLLRFARRDAAVWALGGASIPVITALVNGQDVLLVVLAAAASLAASRRGRPFLAGLLLALCSVKFHMFVFVPVALVLQKRWRMLGGGAVGVAALYVASSLAQGWAWPVPYLHFILSPALHPAPFTMPNLHGLVVATVGDRIGVELFLAAIVAAAVIYMSAGSENFESVFAISIAAGLLTSHHAYIQDCCVLLLIPVFARHRPGLRTISLALLSPPVYFLLLADGWPSALVPAAILGMVLYAAFLATGEREERTGFLDTMQRCKPHSAAPALEQ